MPGSKYASIKNPDLYEKLLRKGYSKERAAKIANSADSMDAMTTTREVPREIKEMPASARKVWTAAFKQAMKEDPEEIAGSLAMSKVRKLFRQEGENWVARGEKERPDLEDPNAGLAPNDPNYDPVAAKRFEAEKEAAVTGEQDPEAEGEGEQEFEGKQAEQEPAAEPPEIAPIDPASIAEAEASQAEELAAMTRAKAKYRSKAKESAATGDSASVQMTEMLTFDSIGFRLTNEGFMVAEPRVARSGIQLYRGWEVGAPQMDTVRVYRPEAEVFDTKAMASMAHRTITLEHPDTRVDASNWKELTVGHSSEPVARDGDFLRVPLVLMDGHAIAAAQSGKSQLSVGYGAKLVWGDGVTPDGQLYDAMQTEIRANHIALVSAARGGDKLRIGDGSNDHGKQKRSSTMPIGRTMNLDGVSIELDDRDAQILQRHLDVLDKQHKDQTAEIDALKAQMSDSQAKLADAVKATGTKDGEIAVLKKNVEDAQVTPDKIDKMMEDRMDLIDRVRGFFGDANYAYKGKTDIQIMRDVVSSHLGEQAAKAMQDGPIEGAFISLTTVQPQDGFTRLTQSFSQAPVRTHNDAAARAYDKRSEDLANRYKRNKKPFGATA